MLDFIKHALYCIQCKLHDRCSAVFGLCDRWRKDLNPAPLYRDQSHQTHPEAPQQVRWVDIQALRLYCRFFQKRHNNLSIFSSANKKQNVSDWHVSSIPQSNWEEGGGTAACDQWRASRQHLPGLWRATSVQIQQRWGGCGHSIGWALTVMCSCGGHWIVVGLCTS